MNLFSLKAKKEQRGQTVFSLAETTLYDVKYSELYFTWKFVRTDQKRSACSMSMVAARMQKMKAGNLTGIGNHNQRKTENHSNPDIDIDRSNLNYELVHQTENYKTDIQAFINENKASSRAIRKDAVLVNEWIITSDTNFFEALSPEQTRSFFEEAKDYFADRFGEQNIRYATVHLDETTPHMHLGVVPFDEDYKLSAKTVFNRPVLREIQEDLPKVLQTAGFDIERGRKGSEQKNLTVPEYKAMKKEQEEIEKKVQQKKEELSAYQKETKKEYPLAILPMKENKMVDVETGEKNIFGQPKMKKEKQWTGNVLLSEEDYLTMTDAIQQGKEAEEKLKAILETDVYEENAFFKAKVESLTEEKTILRKEKKEILDLNNKHVGLYRVLEKENSFLKGEISDLKKELRLLYKTTRSFLKERTSDIKAFKTLFNDFMRDLSEKLTSNGVDNHFEKEQEKEKKKERTQSRGRSR